MPCEVVPLSVDFFKMAAVTIGFHGNAFLNFINTPKLSTHYGEYSYDVS
jgi:hypothetical protein